MVIIRYAKFRNARVDYRLSYGDAKPILLASFSSEGGQGARPRPVGDAGSVSWRSGQNCAK